LAIQHATSSTGIGDILERILDKGVVIAGDIRISLADVELLNIKIRLLVASVDKAREMGIDWWQHDPYLCSGATPKALEAKAEPLGLPEPEQNLVENVLVAGERENAESGFGVGMAASGVDNGILTESEHGSEQGLEESIVTRKKRKTEAREVDLASENRHRPGKGQKKGYTEKPADTEGQGSSMRINRSFIRPEKPGS